MLEPAFIDAQRKRSIRNLVSNYLTKYEVYPFDIYKR